MSATPTTGPGRDLQPLFEPRGIVVAGASTHPGKFGFVSLHNILASGYQGALYALNRDGTPVLDVPTVTSFDEVPEGAVDLVFVCTPASANPDLLRAAAARGVRAAFIAAAGYGEGDGAGRHLQDELVALCDELGMVAAGPNGQGVVSPPVGMCAQIVGPDPPAGHIAVASQSGNLVSSFLNYATQTEVGISRAVSAGNAAMLGVGDYLEWFSTDAETAVGLAYVEGVEDGRRLAGQLRRATAHKPMVLLKGGVSADGQTAAASHTGSLATDDAVFEGMCRQVGVSRAADVEEAFDIAATFATQPLPRGNRVVVLTTAGGWGVMTADAIASSSLELATLPADLYESIDALLPPRWSRNNPVDLAGGETRDTVPQIMELVAAHPETDAVIFLGLGIQSNQARLMRNGPFFPDHGLDRIVDYHERQDRRFAAAAAEASERTRTPILCATELAVADPSNAGPEAVRSTGRLCYPSSHRAVRALDHLWRYARYREQHGLGSLQG